MMIFYKKPRNKTVLAYLQSNGWILDGEPVHFYVLAPPAEFVFDDPSFRLRIPVNDQHFDGEPAYILVQNIARMYEIDLQELFDLFSRPLEVLRFQASLDTAGQEKVQEVLAHAT